MKNLPRKSMELVLSMWTHLIVEISRRHKEEDKVNLSLSLSNLIKSSRNMIIMTKPHLFIIRVPNFLIITDSLATMNISTG